MLTSALAATLGRNKQPEAFMTTQTNQLTPLDRVFLEALAEYRAAKEDPETSPTTLTLLRSRLQLLGGSLAP